MPRPPPTTTTTGPSCSSSMAQQHTADHSWWRPQASSSFLLADLPLHLNPPQRATRTLLLEGVSSPEYDLVSDSATPSAPSSSSSDASSETDPSPSPNFIHAVCNAPLIAPVPLPYHSPTFLQFDLPDEDEDLSHPPYFSRPHKRKRDPEEESSADPIMPLPDAKRRMVQKLPLHQSLPPQRTSPWPSALLQRSLKQYQYRQHHYQTSSSFRTSAWPAVHLPPTALRNCIPG
ncbi:hypothetical protein C8Q75DRAFT_22465 [Abortiporus biennis]|nr:hypothetical protein C8Q75DRAFT_22465 [Abortiporus biennis]